MQCAGVRPWDAVPWCKTYPCQNKFEKLVHIVGFIIRGLASCDLKVVSSFVTAVLVVKGTFWAVTGEVVVLGGRIRDDITSFLSLKAIVREKCLCQHSWAGWFACWKLLCVRLLIVVTGEVDKTASALNALTFIIRGAGNCTLRKVFRKYLAIFKMWCLRRMEISWTNLVRNDVFTRVKEKRNILHATKREEGQLDWSHFA
jgi:hypothetical protein